MRRIIKIYMLMVQRVVNWFKKYMMVFVWSNHVQLIIHFYFATKNNQLEKFLVSLLCLSHTF